ncbi:hypothetical protein FMEAI12_4280049 [Parafrankia sp. Ea1.12]|nr:hypothetical protein FMEAI12_4280049 [Parafrankia sp. Ea1.12]
MKAKRTLATIFQYQYQSVTDQSVSSDPGVRVDYFTRRRDPARHAHRLIGQLTSLGYQVTATPPSAPEPDGQAS